MTAYKVTCHTEGVNMRAIYSSGDNTDLFIATGTAKVLLTAESYLRHCVDKASWVRIQKPEACYNGICYTKIPIGEGVLVAVCYL